MRKAISFILVLTLILSTATCFAFAGTDTKSSATVMRVAAYSGSVSITNAKGKAVTVKEDLKLLSGYTVKTGNASYCYISLDDAKSIKLDQNTKVKIEKSNKKIELTLKSGTLYTDVAEKLKGNESLNIKTSNITTGVRGTKVSMSMLNKAAAKSTTQNSIYNAAPLFELNITPYNGYNYTGDAQQAGGSDGQDTQGVTSITLLEGQLDVSGTDGEVYKQQAGECRQYAQGEDGTEAVDATMAKDEEAFVARTLAEEQAMQDGMTAQEAMDTPTEELFKNVDPSEAPDMVQELMAQAKADPAALTEAIEAAQQEAAAEQEAIAEQQQAESEAARTASGDQPNESVFEDKQVATAKGADGSNPDYSPEANVPAEPQPSGGGSSGGSSGSTDPQHHNWNFDLTCTFDDQDHHIVIDGKTDSENYNFLICKESEYAQLEDLAATAEAIRTEWLGKDADFKSSNPYSSYISSKLDQIYGATVRSANAASRAIKYVTDSGKWYYYAYSIYPDIPNEVGTFNVTVTPATYGDVFFEMNRDPFPVNGLRTSNNGKQFPVAKAKIDGVSHEAVEFICEYYDSNDVLLTTNDSLMMNLTPGAYYAKVFEPKTSYLKDNVTLPTQTYGWYVLPEEDEGDYLNLTYWGSDDGFKIEINSDALPEHTGCFSKDAVMNFLQYNDEWEYINFYNIYRDPIDFGECLRLSISNSPTITFNCNCMVEELSFGDAGSGERLTIIIGSQSTFTVDKELTVPSYVNITNNGQLRMRDEGSGITLYGELLLEGDSNIVTNGDVLVSGSYASLGMSEGTWIQVNAATDAALTANDGAYLSFITSATAAAVGSSRTPYIALVQTGDVPVVSFDGANIISENNVLTLVKKYDNTSVTSMAISENISTLKLVSDSTLLSYLSPPRTVSSEVVGGINYGAINVSGYHLAGENPEHPNNCAVIYSLIFGNSI